jgi:isopentenyl-diphosphate delta-isomerase
VNRISKKTENRKLEHIKICLNEDIEFKTKTTGFEEIELIHHALPELNYQEINLSTKFFETQFDFPILINAMTGGHQESKKINKSLAQIALEFNIPMELGSQRAALENETLIDTYRVARDVSSKIFLIGNIGAAQLVDHPSIKKLEKCIEMIDANALAIHLNPLQEVLQKEGNVNYQNLLKNIKEIIGQIKIPIIIKETGNGLSKSDLEALKSVGVSYVDVSGAGGTSWAAVESYRYVQDEDSINFAPSFRDWGIPTAVSTIFAVKMGFRVISSGGIRSGIDIAKAIACGAGLAGIARPFLKYAHSEDLEALRTQMKILIKELKISSFLTKSHNVEALKSAEKIVFGKTKEWLEAFKL